MDNFFSQQGSEKLEPGGISFALQIFDRIENWLAGPFELTEAEQEDASIHLDDKYCE